MPVGQIMELHDSCRAATPRHAQHAAEQALMSDDALARDAAIREAGEIGRAAHETVAGE
jgi:hypothetical protein